LAVEEQISVHCLDGIPFCGGHSFVG
jgi:hypothetical protein